MRSVSCDTARARVSLQLDGELSPFEASLLARHLRRCGACAAFAEDAHASTELLRAAAPEVPPQFWLARRRAASRGAIRTAAITAATAAAALVAVSTASLYHNRAPVPVGVGLWPVLAIHPGGDENLGVQRVEYERHAPDGPRRGLLST